MDAVAKTLRRFGGVITAPRATIEGLRDDEGLHDGLLLGLLYVFTVGTFALIESAAGLFATRDFNAVIMLASTLGRLLVAPILVLVAAETLLGTGRGHRRGIALLPMLAVAVIGHEVAALGVKLPVYSAEIAGGALGLLLVMHVRNSVTPVRTSDGKEGGR